MKVGILTFHFSENYGAMLQCYALKKTIQKMNMDVEIIDYRADDVNTRIVKNFSKAFIARKLYNIKYHKELKMQKKRFTEFKSKYLLATNAERNVSRGNINELVQQYDVIIFGSDQIWNMDKKLYDRSSIYYGDFEFNGKKISYAASFGDNLESEKNNVEEIKKKLEQFQAVSVREDSANSFLYELGIKAETNLDPTLLLEKEEWEELADTAPIINGDYILYYSVNCRKYSWKWAEKLKQETHMPVINLVAHPKILGADIKNEYSYGPIEFLNIIKNAKYVVTNSFHGTVFAIIFGKKVFPIFDGTRSNICLEERKAGLLKMLGLGDRMLTSDIEVDSMLTEEIDYKQVNKLLESYKEKSLNYLSRNLVND